MTEVSTVAHENYPRFLRRMMMVMIMGMEIIDHLIQPNLHYLVYHYLSYGLKKMNSRVAGLILQLIVGLTLVHSYLDP